MSQKLPPNYSMHFPARYKYKHFIGCYDIVINACLECFLLATIFANKRWQGKPQATMLYEKF